MTIRRFLLVILSLGSRSAMHQRFRDYIYTKEDDYGAVASRRTVTFPQIDERAREREREREAKPRRGDRCCDEEYRCSRHARWKWSVEAEVFFCYSVR